MTTDKSMSPDIRHSQTAVKIYRYDPDRVPGWGNNANLPGREEGFDVEIKTHSELYRRAEQLENEVLELKATLGVFIGLLVGIGAILLWKVMA